MEAIKADLRMAEIINPSCASEETVSVHTKVKVLDINSGEVIVYVYDDTFRSGEEVCISSRSPIGSELLGKRVNTLIRVTTPSGVRRLRIIQITLI